MDLSPQSQLNRLDKRVTRGEAEAIGPTLGEFYGQFHGLIGLRGLWYPGIQDSGGVIPDLTLLNNNLGYNGNPTLALHNNYVPYEDYDGTGDFHSVADNATLDILGTETTIAAASRGLTLGGWFWADASAPIAGLMSKWSNAAAGQSYALRYTGSNRLQFLVGDGVNSFTVTSGAASFPNADWVFCVGRYTPSTVIDVFTNGTKVSFSTAIPAALVNSTQQLEIGRLNAVNLQELDGRWAVAFLCAALIPDTQLTYLFNRSRIFFGV